MKIIEPSVEIWNQIDNDKSQVAKCARVCYASEKITDDGKLAKRLIDNKHYSMFRHVTCYYIIPKKDNPRYLHIRQRVIQYAECPFVNFELQGNIIYLTTNKQFIMEHPILGDAIRGYRVNYDGFKIACPFPDLLRYTICVITQISTSRELNRTSPNNIAEQSTRYVNFGKKGGITICKPEWFNNSNWFIKSIVKTKWKIDEWIYNLILLTGKQPQDAREVLPLATATKCIYTYTVKEWRHILDLRYYGTTGKPHPNAFKIAFLIKQELETKGITFKEL